MFSFLKLEALFVHFFCSSKRNETKKRRPEMTNLNRPYARYTNPPATGQFKFRTISGLPSLHYLVNCVTFFMFMDFKRPQRILG